MDIQSKKKGLKIGHRHESLKIHNVKFDINVPLAK